MDRTKWLFVLHWTCPVVGVLIAVAVGFPWGVLIGGASGVLASIIEGPIRQRIEDGWIRAWHEKGAQTWEDMKRQRDTARRALDCAVRDLLEEKKLAAEMAASLEGLTEKSDVFDMQHEMKKRDRARYALTRYQEMTKGGGDNAK